MRSRIILAAGLFAWIAASASADLKTVSQSTLIYESAKGKSVGRLLAGAQVDQIHPQGEVSQFVVEGWFPRAAFKKIPSLLARNKVLELAEDQAELRSEPGGKVTGRLSKEAKPEMRDVKGKWIKAALTGWISSVSLEAEPPGPRVRLSTTVGDIVVELANPARAPKTVANFLSYVDTGHYDGTIFHRVIENFMIQGGGFTEQLAEKPSAPPIPIESNNGLKNVRGTLAMARTGDPNSATAQFFINVVDNDFLNYQSAASAGYAVFGRVVSGMDVVDHIRKVPTGAAGRFSSDVPQTMVVITKASRVE